MSNNPKALRYTMTFPDGYTLYFSSVRPYLYAVVGHEARYGNWRTISKCQTRKLAEKRLDSFKRHSPEVPVEIVVINPA